MLAQCHSMRNRTREVTLLDRRRDAARRLGVSESQILKFEREGLLRRVEVPGIRAVRYDSAEVAALAQRWIDAAKARTAVVDSRIDTWKERV